jgi:hypothetical protein
MESSLYLSGMMRTLLIDKGAEETLCYLVCSIGALHDIVMLGGTAVSRYVSILISLLRVPLVLLVARPFLDGRRSWC